MVIGFNTPAGNPNFNHSRTPNNASRRKVAVTSAELLMMIVDCRAELPSDLWVWVGHEELKLKGPRAPCAMCLFSSRPLH